MPAPSWDLAISVFFLIGIAFGYILQREKIIATLSKSLGNVAMMEKIETRVRQLVGEGK